MIEQYEIFLGIIIVAMIANLIYYLSGLKKIKSNSGEKGQYISKDILLSIGMKIEEEFAHGDYYTERFKKGPIFVDLDYPRNDRSKPETWDFLIADIDAALKIPVKDLEAIINVFKYK